MCLVEYMGFFLLTLLLRLLIYLWVNIFELVSFSGFIG